MNMVHTSRLERFHEKTLEERLLVISEGQELSTGELDALKSGSDPVMLRVLDGMCENVIGSFPLPLGIATNFVINGVDRLVTMAVEEASVIAAASNAARMARPRGGFTCDPVKGAMIGQVQLVHVEHPDLAIQAIKAREADILEKANARDALLVAAGGGAEKIEASVVNTSRGMMVDVHVIVNCLDAMGANAVNTMAETIAPFLEEITGGKALLKIISNLAVHRVARATATFDKELIGGEEVISRILDAVAFAEHDMFRAATHNKGIMNGVSSVVLASGNDTRAVEAGAHAYAAWGRPYSPLTRYSVDSAGHLRGEIAIPTPVGIIGGATKTHPVAKTCLKIMDVDSAATLSQILAAVGLAQNLAALRALASEGIQQGHMRLHARKFGKP